MREDLTTFEKCLITALKLKNREELCKVMAVAAEDERSLSRAFQLLQENLVPDGLWGLDKRDVIFFYVVYQETLISVLYEQGRHYYLAELINVWLEENGLTSDHCSVTEHSIELSEEAIALIESQFSEELLEYIRPMYTTLEQLEKNLQLEGYFDRLSQLASKRIEQWEIEQDWSSIGSYLNFFVGGTIARFPMLSTTSFEEDCHKRFLNESTSRMLNYLLAEGYDWYLDPEACNLLMLDMLKAMGLNPDDQELVFWAEGERCYTIEALRALGKVWETNGPRPIRELVADLTVAENQLQQEEANDSK